MVKNKGKILQLGLRVIKEFDEDVVVTESNSAVNFIKDKFEAIDIYEECFAIYLNNQNKVLGFAQIGKGGVRYTAVDTAIVMKYAVSCLASGIILSHNHPSRSTKPSREDEKLTDNLVQAGKILNIPLLDHIIITNNSFYSFRDEGRIY